MTNWKDLNKITFSSGKSCEVKFVIGRTYYNRNGLHNEDGPAIIYSDGSCDYYLDGTYLSYEEWLIARTIL